jgi:hypothetical protein
MLAFWRLFLEACGAFGFGDFVNISLALCHGPIGNRHSNVGG